MQILFLLPEFPYPPSTGGRSKVFNELSYLSMRHKCDLLCFGEVDSDQINALVAKLPNVKVLGVVKCLTGIKKWIKMVWALMRMLPPSFSKYSSSEFSGVLSELLRVNNYDVVHYDIINMAQYLPQGTHLASVHSPNDATSLSYLRMAEQEERITRKISLLISSMLLKRYEIKHYPRFTKVHVVSPIDAKYLNDNNPLIDINVIPITIDDEFISLNSISSRCSGSSKTIICTGNFGNSSIARGLEEFLVNSYPLITNALPEVKFLILGQNANEPLKELINKAVNAEFITWVDNYRDFLIQADVILAPDLAGTGIKTRVIQAMGLGLPVVGTEIAYEAIPIINGEEGFIYQSSAECADIFIELLRNNNECLAVGERAQRLAEENFSLVNVGPRYEDLYESAVRIHELTINA